MEEILHQLIGGLSHYFRVLTIPLVVQDFFHPLVNIQKAIENCDLVR